MTLTPAFNRLFQTFFAEISGIVVYNQNMNHSGFKPGIFGFSPVFPDFSANDIGISTFTAAERL